MKPEHVIAYIVDRQISTIYRELSELETLTRMFLNHAYKSEIEDMMSRIDEWQMDLSTKNGYRNIELDLDEWISLNPGKPPQGEKED